MGRGAAQTASVTSSVNPPVYVPSQGVPMEVETYQKDVVGGRLLGAAHVGRPGDWDWSVEDLPGRHEAAVFLTPERALVSVFFVEDTVTRKRRLLPDKEVKTGSARVWELYRGKSVSEALSAADRALEERPDGFSRSQMGLHHLDEQSVLAQLTHVWAESQPPQNEHARREIVESLGLSW